MTTGDIDDALRLRQLEQQTTDLAEHLRLALDAGGLGTWRWDMATGVTVWDERLEALFGLGPGEFEGTYEAWLARQHPDDLEMVIRTVEDAVRTKSGYRMDHRVVWPDGTVRWLQGRGQVLLDADGAVVGTIGCVGDVTEQMEAAQERERLRAEAEQALDRERLDRQRLEFLAQIDDALRDADDQATLTARVTAVSVPRLGDWCSLAVLPPDSQIPDITVAHVDPAMVSYAEELQRRFPYDPDAPMGVPAVIRTGRTEHVAEITDEMIDEADVDDEVREIVRQLALRSTIVVPLRRRGRTLGAMQFVMSSTGRVYDAADVALAELVAVRVAAALADVRDAEHQRVIATTLQKSLLPSFLPDVPGLEVAVRYWAAGESTEVGGDFYDLFALDDDHDRWGLAIGDVCGTGPTAAAVTAMARHTIRTSAWHGDDPVEVLACLNRAMQAAHAESFLTGVYGELDTEEMRVEMAIAGHPHPVVVEPGQPARLVGRQGTMLGPFPSPRLELSTVTLAPGAALVLYTDGVTDVPPPNGLDEAGLVALVGDAVRPGDSAEQIADRLRIAISQQLPLDSRPDDIALMVLRVVGEEVAVTAV